MDALYVISLILVIAGVAGTILPFVPGMLLVLGGIALYAIGTGFSVISPWLLAILLVIGLTGLALDFLGNALGARRFGATRAGMIGAVLGLLAGLILLGPFLGPLAIVVGPLLGAAAGELLQGREPRVAFRSGFGAVIGTLFGTLAEFIIALILAGWFIWLTLGTQIGQL